MRMASSSPRNAQSGELAGQDRLGETGRHETLGGQIIHLLRPILLQDADHAHLIQQIALDDLYLMLDVFDAIKVDGAGAANHADDSVSLAKQ